MRLRKPVPGGACANRRLSRPEACRPDRQYVASSSDGERRA
jgi:hypothetical protein